MTRGFERFIILAIFSLAAVVPLTGSACGGFLCTMVPINQTADGSVVGGGIGSGSGSGSGSSSSGDGGSLGALEWVGF